MSREADIKYQPKVKELKDVVCSPTDTLEDRALLDFILSYYERTYWGVEGDTDRSDLQSSMGPSGGLSRNWKRNSKK